MQSFRSVRGALLQTLQSLLTNKGKKETSNDDQKWQIFVTGHSLGGALASLCAFEIGRIRAGTVDEDTNIPALEISISVQYSHAHIDPSVYRILKHTSLTSMSLALRNCIT